MRYKALLITCTVTFWASTQDEIDLPCGGSFNSTPHVFWPDIENGTCSTSIPSCTTTDGFLEIRCCIEGKPTEVDCTRNDSIQDPTCLGNMKSTVGNTSLQLCYELVKDTTYPFECKSKTGHMMAPDFEILTLIGGYDTGIWLPINKYNDTFRYSTINSFYMESFGNLSSVDSSARCVILKGGATKVVPCNEHYVGICLDFPFVIHQFFQNKLDDLLFDVKDFCLTIERKRNDFCSYFLQRYHMNLVYFSSRYYIDDPYIILQKSNSRFILQIRKDDNPKSNGTINIHVALKRSDWDIFTNTSFPFKRFDSTDINIYKLPNVILSAFPDHITISKTNPNNIKWTQMEEYTQYIFCFYSAAPQFQLRKFEVLDTYQIDLNDKNAVVWCEAFDFDLKVSSSNIISLGDQNIFHYITEMTAIIGGIQSCDIFSIRIITIDSFEISKHNTHFYFDIRDLGILHCELNKIAEVNISVYWYPKFPALSIYNIEQEYSKFKGVIENIRMSNENIFRILEGPHIRHSDYCLKETTIIGNLSFTWPTTPNNNKAMPYPLCYSKTLNETRIVERNCVKSSSGSSWSVPIENCEPTSNLTYLLEVYSSEEFSQTGILHNLNNLVQKYYERFHVPDVHLLSKIITQLKIIPSNIEKGLHYLSLLVNNLHFIQTDVLKISQDKYQTTDSIMNSSDSLYVTTGGSQNMPETSHCYYTINFTKHPNATGVFLLNSGKNREIKLLESDILSRELMQNDSFEAAIFFDAEFLKHSKGATNVTTVKLSIFFDNYLFDVNHLSANTRTIFKVLLPHKNELQPFTSFLTMKTQKKAEICSCWKYGTIQNSTLESKWYRTTKFDVDSHPVCVIKSFSYCTIFAADSEDTNLFISRLSIEYSNKTEHKKIAYFMYTALSSILDQIQVQLLDKVTYEFEDKSNMDFTQKIHEIKVLWIPNHFTQLLAEIEREYNDLYQAIKISAESLANNKFVDFINVHYLRHKEYCMNDIYKYKNFTIIFETTPQNESTISLPLCYTSKGILQRKCIGDYDIGSYWEPLDNPPFLNCGNITEILDYVLEKFHDTDADNVLDGLEKITAKSAEDFRARDIFLVSEILFLISDSPQNVSSQSLSALTSNIQQMHKGVLKDAQLQFNATDQILYSLDRILLKSNITMNKQENFYTVELRNLNKYEGLILQRNGNEYNISIIDGSENQHDVLENYTNFESAVFFNNFNRSDSIIVSLFLQNVLFVDSTWSHSVSVIFGILLPDQSKISEIPGEIELVFKNHEGKDKACAFWKYGFEGDVKISGKWKNESKPNNKLNFSSCKFNHTTHFAMLIDDGDSDPDYLEIITNIGCLLSMIGLLGILITGLIFERWRKNLGNIILMNFVLTVIIQILLFYFSGFIHKVFGRSESCVLVGTLLHYSIISEFCWMLIIAILQFKRFVQVLTRPPKHVLLKSFLCGWGFPLIPVLSVLLVDPSNYSYSETGLCYPSKLGLYLGVWLPILVITLINSIIFSYIMYSIFNRKTECVDTVSNEVIFQWRLAVLLYFMLGLTWMFAFIGEFMLKEIFLFLFCITSTLQGFIMFLFFIVFNERTRLLYSGLLKRI